MLHCKITSFFGIYLFTELGYGSFPKFTQDYNTLPPQSPLTGPHKLIVFLQDLQLNEGGALTI